jgi:cell division protein FtsQ
MTGSADRGEVVGPAEPSPRVEREVEPETLVSTVEHELTVIPDVDDGPERQDDTNPIRTDGAAQAPVEVDGEAAASVIAPQGRVGEAALLGVTPEAPPEAPGRHRTHGRLKTWVIVCGVLAALALAALGSTYTPLFAADSVRVEGGAHLSAAQVRRIAGVRPGENVVHLDTERAERRLERNAWIADAQISTRLPSTVTIAIRERRATAVVATDSQGALALVAEDGTILGTAPRSVRLPALEAADGAVVPTDAQRTDAAAVAASLPPAVVHEVDGVLADSDGTLSLSLVGGVPVSYGDTSALAEKGQALRAVLGWAERRGIHLESIDVTSPGAPTASLAGGGPIIGNPWQR